MLQSHSLRAAMCLPLRGGRMTLSPRLAREGESSKYLLNSTLLYFGSPWCAVHREEPVCPLCPSLNTVVGRTGQNTEIEMPGLCISETCLCEGSWWQNSDFDGRAATGEAPCSPPLRSHHLTSSQLQRPLGRVGPPPSEGGAPLIRRSGGNDSGDTGCHWERWTSLESSISLMQFYFQCSFSLGTWCHSSNEYQEG